MSTTPGTTPSLATLSMAPQPGTTQAGRPLVPSAREERFFLVLSVFLGVFAGLAVVTLRIAIDWSKLLLLGPEPGSSSLRLVLAPTLVGLLIAFLVIRIFPTARGSGVTQTKSALYILNGFISFRTTVGKFLLSALAIGSGQSLGPEDPSLQVGAGLASMLGRRLHLSREKLRLIAPVGAAAGLAAAFNAPISAVLFVIEEVVGRWSAGVLGAVVLSSISSVVVMRWFLGAAPMFRIPALQLVSPRELLAYAVLGIVGGLVAVLFARSIVTLRPRLNALPSWAHYLLPSTAGLLIGLMGALGAPQVMGAGYESIDQAMHNQFTWKLLAVLVILKLIATTLSFASGTPGGMFAPTLFVGAMLGGLVGAAAHSVFPSLTGSTATYVLVGMGVLFAGFLRVPMTSVFMVLEVSGNYSVIVPVIVANTLAYVVSRELQPIPIFDVLTRQDGLELPSMEERRDESFLHVEDAMRSAPWIILDSEQSVQAAMAAIQNVPGDNFLVRVQPTGWSLLNRKDLQNRVSEGKQDLNLSAVLPARRAPYLHPDQDLDVALRWVKDWALIPVVSRADFRRLEGVVSQLDVLARYESWEEEE